MPPQTRPALPEARSKGRPSREEASGIDRAIRAAAIRVLLEQGETATLNAVAETARLSRKTVYARYANKADLFVAAVRDMLTDVGPVQFDRTGPFQQRLANYIAEAFALLTSRKSMILQQALLTDPAHLAGLRGELAAASNTIFFKPLVGLLEEARASGEMAPVDCAGVARIIVSVLAMESHAARHDGPFGAAPLTPDGIAALLSQVVSLGVLPRA